MIAAPFELAFTKRNIQAGFKQVGLWPLNSTVITPAMMAPSLATSTTSGFPLRIPSTPIRTVLNSIAEAMRHPISPFNALIRTVNEDLETLTLDEPSITLPIATFDTNELDLPTPTIGEVVIKALQGTRLANLVNGDPLPLNQPPPTPYISNARAQKVLKHPSPRKRRPTQTQMSTLVRELAASRAETVALKQELQVSDMTNIIQHMHLQKMGVERALATKSGKKATYFTDGKGEELTDKAFIARVHNAEEATKAKKDQEKIKAALKATDKARAKGGKDAWARWKAEYDAAKAQWDDRVKKYPPRKIPAYLTAQKPKIVLKRDVIAKWERENENEATAGTAAMVIMPPVVRRGREGNSEEDFESFMAQDDSSEDGWHPDDEDD